MRDVTLPVCDTGAHLARLSGRPAERSTPGYTPDVTEPRDDDRLDPADPAETGADSPAGARSEREREADATIRSISRLEESN